jgi:uncharacterized paraquat-inducible protein A
MIAKATYTKSILFTSTLLSLALLYPGIFSPIFTIQGELSVPIIGKLDLGTTTRSIWGTVQFLYDSNNNLVATLILLFSVIIPILKSILLLWVLAPMPSQFIAPKKPLLTWLNRIGKWSMADVFVVAVFLAYLATGSMKVFSARLENGFYFFLAYCILSMGLTGVITLFYSKKL